MKTDTQDEMPDPDLDALARALTDAAWPVTQEKPLFTDLFEEWDKGLHPRARDEAERERNWARIALLYVYLEAKMLMCTHPDFIRHTINVYRDLSLHIGDRGWLAFHALKPEEASK